MADQVTSPEQVQQIVQQVQDGEVQQFEGEMQAVDEGLEQPEKQVPEQQFVEQGGWVEQPPMFSQVLQPLPTTFGIQLPQINLSQPDFQFSQPALNLKPLGEQQQVDGDNTFGTNFPFVFYPAVDQQAPASAALISQNSTVITRDAGLSSKKKTGGAWKEMCKCFRS